MSNFAFLQTEWPLMHESALRVEATANTDARTSCFYARGTLEMAVAWQDCPPHWSTMTKMLNALTWLYCVPNWLFSKPRH